jgi:poly(3-hydroxybutyrate) depolymerase
MYDPGSRDFPNLALLWPAFAAATASDMAALVAKHFANLAIGMDARQAAEPAWTTPNRVALELKTVRLRDFSLESPSSWPKECPLLLCAPFALHGAILCDLAPRHSLVGALHGAGTGRLFLTDWRSATADMRLLDIDDYLADLNVLVDDIGPPVDLVGLCQGGWMATVYAARFPKKVRKLVLAAAPIDVAAAASPLSAIAAATPLAAFHELVRLGNGIASGRKALKFWAPDAITAEDIRQLLQTDAAPDSPAFANLETAFRAWYAWTLDLPGSFFLETVDRLYKRNELATGGFTALGQRIELASINAPLFLLAAHDDEVVAPAQVLAAQHLVGTAAHEISTMTVPCRHLGLFMGKHALSEAWPAVARWRASPADASAHGPRLAVAHSH